MKNLISAVIVSGMLLVAQGAHAESAMQQLLRATNGSQHTGTTFDGSPRDQKRGGIDTEVRTNK
jgi:hypothetical protein